MVRITRDEQRINGIIAHFNHRYREIIPLIHKNASDKSNSYLGRDRENEKSVFEYHVPYFGSPNHIGMTLAFDHESELVDRTQYRATRKVPSLAEMRRGLRVSPHDRITPNKGMFSIWEWHGSTEDILSVSFATNGDTNLHSGSNVVYISPQITITRNGYGHRFIRHFGEQISQIVLAERFPVKRVIDLGFAMYKHPEIKVRQ